MLNIENSQRTTKIAILWLILIKYRNEQNKKIATEMISIEKLQRATKIATSSSISTRCREKPRSQLKWSILKNRNEPLNRDSKFHIDKNIATNTRIATEMPHIEKSQRTESRNSKLYIDTISLRTTLATALLDTKKSQQTTQSQHQALLKNIATTKNYKSMPDIEIATNN